MARMAHHLCHRHPQFSSLNRISNLAIRIDTDAKPFDAGGIIETVEPERTDDLRDAGSS